jgi:hypothetical protein
VHKFVLTIRKTNRGDTNSTGSTHTYYQRKGTNYAVVRALVKGIRTISASVEFRIAQVGVGSVQEKSAHGR